MRIVSYYGFGDGEESKTHLFRVAKFICNGSMTFQLLKSILVSKKSMSLLVSGRGRSCVNYKSNSEALFGDHGKIP